MMSGTPSPVLALMGISATALVKSSIRSYLSAKTPSDESCEMMLYMCSSKAASVWACCFFSEMTKAWFSSEIHPSTVSILLRAITKGVLYCLRMWMDSMVWGISPSLMSMTRTARSAREPPLARREVNAWCPGVSMKSNPGTVKRFFPMMGPHIS